MDNTPTNPQPEPLQPKVIDPIIPQTPHLPPEQVNPAPVMFNSKPDDDEADDAKGTVDGGGFGEFLSTIGILLTALAVAVLMILFVFRSYQVDGPSMETTLSNGDKLIIWKVPRTIASISGNDYIPNRGDVIVFTEGGLSAYGQVDTKQLIKRVVAVPGERVVVSAGVLTVYNKEFPTGFQPDKIFEYGKVIGNTSGDVDVTLRPGQVFVSGDNRPDSLDSRSFGPIDSDQIVGKLILRVFPLNEAKLF